MADYKIRKNDGKWHHMNGMDGLMSAIFSLGSQDTLELKQECFHDETWVDNGIKICKNCGEQLEVTSWRD